MSSQSHPKKPARGSISPTALRRTLNESARLLSQNQPDEAVKKLLPLYRQRPADPDVAINLGGAYILQRKWDKAVRLLERAVEANPDSAMLWTNLAAAYLGRLDVSGPRQQERAIGAYHKALEIDPKTPNVHYHLGLIYKDRNELMQASIHFQRALDVNPADRDARLWLKRVNSALDDAAPDTSDSGSTEAQE